MKQGIVKFDRAGREHREPDDFVMTTEHFRIFRELAALDHPDIPADDSVELPERFDADFDGAIK